MVDDAAVAQGARTELHAALEHAQHLVFPQRFDQRLDQVGRPAVGQLRVLAGDQLGILRGAARVRPGAMLGAGKRVPFSR